MSHDWRLLAALPFLLAAAGCERPLPTLARPTLRPDTPAQGSAVAAPAPAASRRFGEALTANMTATRLGELVQSPDRFRDRPLRVEGRIAAVCQNMGCWMEIRDEALQAHIRMHGHSFFVPRDVQGHRARIQGTLVAAHTPTECDQEARTATGRPSEVEFDATGVEVLD